MVNNQMQLKPIKPDMKNKFVVFFEKLLLKKRNIVESVNNILKNTFRIDHSRHRSVKNFFTNVFAGIAAYSFHQHKPAIGVGFFAEIKSVN